MSTDKPIRVGVVGVGRGLSFARGAEHAGLKLVALCDTWAERLASAGKELGVTTYTEYDRFLEHDLDAVVLANYFHEHAPFAIKALAAGKHVMSETSACKTLAEGVALARAVERSGRTYMLAENYAYAAAIQDMRARYRAGAIGEVQYAEGEYVHPDTARNSLARSQGTQHWRHWIPNTYYCTHALSPVMYVTDTRPQSVNALSIAQPVGAERPWTLKRSDPAFVLLTRLSNGAVARLIGLQLRGHGTFYRFHGTRGLMETVRTGHRGHVRVVHDEFDRRPDEPAELLVTPDFPEHADLARKAGHGGGDFFMDYHFAQAIRTGQPPYFDVYRALEMTLVGIQGWRSCLANGAPFEVPDLRREDVRQRYEADDWSPMPQDRRPGQPPSSIRGELTPTPEALAQARALWAERGYHGE